jgi:hypothetical protein
MRQRLKLKLKGNEEEMEERKRQLRKSLSPTFVSLIPSRNYAKMIRNPTNWSSLPPKPKYSRIDPKPRIYGKRFEIWESEISDKSREMPREYMDAIKKMTESVAELRKNIVKRTEELAKTAEADKRSG